MSDLRDLYQELILDHSKQPRNFGTLDDADRDADGHNPLCGDRLRIYVNLADDVIDDVRFEGSGCAISTASASVMTQVVKGKTLSDAKDLFEKFHALVTGKTDVDSADYGKLRRVRRRVGVPRAREVRHALLAHPPSRAQQRARDHIHRVRRRHDNRRRQA